MITVLVLLFIVTTVSVVLPIFEVTTVSVLSAASVVHPMSFVQMCVALVLGEVFQNKTEAEYIYSKITLKFTG